MCHVTQSPSDWGMALVDAAREHTYGRNDRRAFGMHRAGSSPACSHLKDQKPFSPAQRNVQTTLVLLGIFDRLSKNRPNRFHVSEGRESPTVGAVLGDSIKSSEDINAATH